MPNCPRCAPLTCAPKSSTKAEIQSQSSITITPASAPKATAVSTPICGSARTSRAARARRAPRVHRRRRVSVGPEDLEPVGEEPRHRQLGTPRPLFDPAAEPQIVRPRVADVEYHLDDWGDRFVVLTNENAVDFRVMEAPLDDPANWTELIPHESGRRIVAIEPFAGQK